MRTFRPINRHLSPILALGLGFACPASAQTYTLTDGNAVAPLEMFQECDVCPEMIVLPLGSFTMGAPPEQSAALDLRREIPPDEERGLATEGPQHEVEIDIPIAVARNEVTYDEWMTCVADGGCGHTPDPTLLTRAGVQTITGRSPVRNVSYLDILAYVAWLNEKAETQSYRLPTEAEWEYAARAGTSTPFAQGEMLTTDQANVLGDVKRGIPIPVDDLDAANGWGLRHMSGNVIEHTMSCWSPRHLGLETSSAYLTHAQEASTCRRVTKGGAFTGSKILARPAIRGVSDEDTRTDIAGFRLVRELR